MNITINGLNINFNSSRQKFIRNGVKIVVPAAAAIIASDEFIRNNNELDFDSIREDINYETEINNELAEKEFDYNYHIDLGLANSKAFRDRELFNPNLDNETDLEYRQYDNDDIKVPHKSSNNRFNENYAGYRITDTDFGYKDMPDAVKKPFDNKYDITENVIKIQKYRENLKKDSLAKKQKQRELIQKKLDRLISEQVMDVLKKTSLVKEKRLNEKVLDKNLLKLSIYLYNNKSNQDSNYIDPIVFEIMKKINIKDKELSNLLLEKVKNLLLEGYDNFQILKYVKEFTRNYRCNSLEYMDCYNVETGRYQLYKLR